jgi:hypothetical protein
MFNSKMSAEQKRIRITAAQVRLVKPCFYKCTVVGSQINFIGDILFAEMVICVQHVEIDLADTLDK